MGLHPHVFLSPLYMLWLSEIRLVEGVFFFFIDKLSNVSITEKASQSIQAVYWM